MLCWPLGYFQTNKTQHSSEKSIYLWCYFSWQLNIFCLHSDGLLKPYPGTVRAPRDIGCQLAHSGQICHPAVLNVTAMHAGWWQACPVSRWGWPSSMCSKQRDVSLSLVSNEAPGRKIPYMFSFPKKNCCKKHDKRWRHARDGSCITLLSPMRLRNCCFAFFSLKSISPLSRCTSRKGAEAAASQRICARQTVKYLKPELSEGRPLAHVIETYNAQTLGHLGLS